MGITTRSEYLSFSSVIRAHTGVTIIPGKGMCQWSRWWFPSQVTHSLSRPKDTTIHEVLLSSINFVDYSVDIDQLIPIITPVLEWLWYPKIFGCDLFEVVLVPNSRSTDLVIGFDRLRSTTTMLTILLTRVQSRRRCDTKVVPSEVFATDLTFHSTSIRIVTNPRGLVKSSKWSCTRDPDLTGSNS